MVGGVEDFGDLLGHSSSSGVAVAYGISEQVAVAGDESKVYAPRVYPNAFHLIPFGCRLFKAVFHVGKEGGEVPINVFAQAHLTVGEAVYFLHNETSAVEPTGYDAPTATAEVGGKIYFIHKGRG